jgi:hypothetical protein
MDPDTGIVIETLEDETYERTGRISPLFISFDTHCANN